MTTIALLEEYLDWLNRTMVKYINYEALGNYTMQRSYKSELIHILDLISVVDYTEIEHSIRKIEVRAQLIEKVRAVKNYLKIEDISIMKAALKSKEDEDLASKSKEVVKSEMEKWKEYLDSVYPTKLSKQLDRFVVGQEKAKKVLSTAVYNHFKRFAISKLSGEHIRKFNILLLGDTGSGKTLLVKTLAKILDVPFSTSDATTMTEAGYVGEDVESCLHGLIPYIQDNVINLDYSIIYIDEIDKLASTSSHGNIDVSRKGVQRGLLKLIEGTKTNIVMGKRNAMGEKSFPIDTSNMLFIVSGAFSGLVDIIKERLNKKEIGFNSKVEKYTKDAYLSLATTEDFVNYGIIPELLGRITNYVHVHQLNDEMLLKVLTEPENSVINDYKSLFALDNVTLDFTTDALKYIAKLGLKQKAGARGLTQLLDEVLVDFTYNIGKYKFKQLLITKSIVKSKLKHLDKE